MKAFCKSISGASVPLNARREGESEETVFSPLRVGETYQVYGIMFSDKRVDLFVCPDSNGPCWMPSDLFAMHDSTLPHWKLCQTAGAEGFSQLKSVFGVVAIIGYDLLVSDYSHYVGVLERDEKHLQDFYALKITADLDQEK
jgi:hypothetical protein